MFLQAIIRLFQSVIRLFHTIIMLLKTIFKTDRGMVRMINAEQRDDRYDGFWAQDGDPSYFRLLVIVDEDYLSSITISASNWALILIRLASRLTVAHASSEAAVRALALR